MRASISHRQRLENCLSGDKGGGIPVALWRHFPVDDQKADSLAGAHLDFQRLFDFDLLKVTPASSYLSKRSKEVWHENYLPQQHLFSWNNFSSAEYTLAAGSRIDVSGRTGLSEPQT